MKSFLYGFILFLITYLVATNTVAADGKIVAECRFEGPYYKAGQTDQLQKGWTNNYNWGDKDIHLSIVPGVTGHAQLIDIRGIASGEWQYFFSSIALKRGHYYRIRFMAKAENFEGRLSVQVRKTGKPPLTRYFPPEFFSLTDDWREYVLEGTAPTDVDREIALLFSTGAIGQLWIDDLIVEEFATKPADAKTLVQPILYGNLFPRSSFEGERDWLWTSGIHSTPFGEWEDPQICRASGGKFGRYCLALPTAKTPNSTQFIRSYWIPVVPGHPYIFSVWMKAAQAGVPVRLSLRGQNGRTLGSRDAILSSDWQRYSVSVSEIPDGIVQVFAGINMTSSEKSDTIYADGFQLETGTAASDYSSRFPIEVYAIMRADGLNIVEWDTPAAVRLSARSATGESGASVSVSVRLVGFPDRECWKRKMELAVNEDVEIDLGTKLRGLFRLEITPEDLTVASEQELLFAVLPPPRPTGSESMFGTHITVRPFFIEYAKRIGMKWQRFHDGSHLTKWYFAEPKPNTFQWADEPVDALKKAGFHLLGLPDRPPNWAICEEKDAQNVIDVNAFAKYCSELSRHYRGRIDHWEIWNEPYMKSFFKGTPNQYAEVLRVGAAAIREGNPDAKILGFCTEATGIDYAERIPVEDRRWIDILSFHGYFKNLTGGGTSNFRAEVDRYRDFLGEQVVEGFWNTEGAHFELGRNSFYRFLSDPDLNLRAAAFGARVWIEQRKAGIDKLFLYTLHQSDTVLYLGGYRKLIGFDRSVTPAAVATAVCAWAIDGLVPHDCPAKVGIVQSLFVGKDRSCYIVFDDGAVPGRLCFDLSKIPDEWQVVDVMGNDPRQTGQKEIELGILPLFIIAPGECFTGARIK